MATPPLAKNKKNTHFRHFYKTSRTASLTQIRTYIYQSLGSKSTNKTSFLRFKKKIKKEERNQDLGQHSSTVQAIGLNIINDSNDHNAS